MPRFRRVDDASLLRRAETPEHLPPGFRVFLECDSLLPLFKTLNLEQVQDPNTFSFLVPAPTRLHLVPTPHSKGPVTLARTEAFIPAAKNKRRFGMGIRAM